MRLFATIAAAALLAACAPPATTPPAPPVASSPRHPDAPPSTIAERDTCNAQPASGLVGQPASAANAERARQLAGAKIVRICASTRS